MVLYQLDVGKRVPYDGNPSGWYYWTSVYYYDLADFTSPLAMRARALDVDRLHTLDVVQYTTLVEKTPPGRANVVASIDESFNHGSIITAGRPWNLLTVGRLILRYADGRQSYRFWRGPMLYEWTHGGVWSSAALAYMGSYINNQRPVSGHQAARNLYGAVCVGGVVPRSPSSWQLRHGTKRRERTN